LTIFVVKVLVSYETEGGHGEHDSIEEAIRTAIQRLPIKPTVEIMEPTKEDLETLEESKA